MSTHLPECDLSYDCGLPHVQSYCHQCEMYCVCDRLNACTARMRAACISAVEAQPFWIESTDQSDFEVLDKDGLLAALREVQP